MENETKQRHVIILGAGASVSSGYPMANGLRLLMSSEASLRKELESRGKFNKDYTGKVINKMMGGEVAEAVQLFRHGGFASVDEFSKLASPRYHRQVQGLKRLLRLALSLHDPEEFFMIPTTTV